MRCRAEEAGGALMVLNVYGGFVMLSMLAALAMAGLLLREAKIRLHLPAEVGLAFLVGVAGGKLGYCLMNATLDTGDWRVGYSMIGAFFVSWLYVWLRF